MINRQKFYIACIKRPIDFLGALMAIVVTSPVILGTIVALFFSNKNGFKGVFFTQERPGKDKKIFKVIKFKTMTDETDGNGNLLPNSMRLTPIGKKIRAFSIDELPQLFNILKGDMAFIGPRPLLTWFLPLYSETQIKRHDVTPGLTGWAQVNGRNTITYSKKFEYDLWYVENISLCLDVKIFFLTVHNVFSKKDIGNGLQDEVDDLGWNSKINEAKMLFEKNYRNKK